MEITSSDGEKWQEWKAKSATNVIVMVNSLLFFDNYCLNNIMFPPYFRSVGNFWKNN